MKNFLISFLFEFFLNIGKESYLSKSSLLIRGLVKSIIELVLLLLCCSIVWEFKNKFLSLFFMTFVLSSLLILSISNSSFFVVYLNLEYE